jgi:hypothetical protein
MTGLKLMADIFDWTARESLTRLRSDIFVQMALDLPEIPTDDERFLSERTWYDFRKKLQEADGPWLAALSIQEPLLRGAPRFGCLGQGRGRR